MRYDPGPPGAARKDRQPDPVHADLALGHFFAGKAAEAQAAVDKALALDGKNRLALYIKGELALKNRMFKVARAGGWR